MFKGLISDDIALAHRHLSEAEMRIAKQRLCVSNSVGQEREKAAALLEIFLRIREQMQRHLALLDEDLRLAQRNSLVPL